MYILRFMHGQSIYIYIINIHLFWTDIQQWEVQERSTQSNSEFNKVKNLNCLITQPSIQLHS